MLRWTFPLLIAIGEALFGYNGLGWRFTGAVLGTIMVALVVRIVRRISRSTLVGAIAGILVIADGVSFVVARTALLDGFLAFLVLAAGPNGSADRAVPLLGFLAPTIVSLLALARVESSQQQQADQHTENSLRLANLAAEIQGVGAIATQSATSAAAAATASQAAAEVHNKAAEVTT